MRCAPVLPLLLGCLTFPARLDAAMPEISQRRLYQFAPVSATNPVLAGVKESGLEIPVTEFRAYVELTAGRVGDRKHKTLSLAEKRRYLEELLDDHLLMWDGYRKQADQTPAVIDALKSDQAMFLQEALLQQEIGDKAKTAVDYERLSRKLRDDLFEKTNVEAFEDAYSELKAAVKRLNETSSASSNSPPGTTLPDLALVPAAIRAHPLARCKFRTVTIGDVLGIYVQMLPEERPDLQTREGVTEILKRLLEEGMRVQEARARGFENAPAVVESMQKSRNTLTRQYAQDQLYAQAAAQLNDAGLDARVKQWYLDHLKDRYTSNDRDGKTRVVGFEEQRDSIQGDYVDSVREQTRIDAMKALRKGGNIQVDEKLLDQLAISVPVPIPATLASSVIAWDSDVKEHIFRGSETNALFTFQLTNVSPGEVTIYNVEPACECTTVKTPPLPWKLGPGARGEVQATVDLRGKTNSYNRSVDIESSEGPKTLTLHIVVPELAKAAAVPH